MGRGGLAKAVNLAGLLITVFLKVIGSTRPSE